MMMTLMMSTTTTTRTAESPGRASSSLLLFLRRYFVATAPKAPALSSSSSFCRGRLLLLLAASFAGATAAPTTVKLDFEGVVNNIPVEDFYDGGAGGPNKDFGITFGPDAAGAVDFDDGGTYLIANEPSGRTVVEFIGSSFVTVLGGFTAMSFQYASVFSLNVTAYDGPDLTGNVLGTASLPPTGRCGVINGISACGDPSGTWGKWANVTVPFNGVAKSSSFETLELFLDDMMITLVTAPTNPPTKAPTNVPTNPPTNAPTNVPTKAPTKPPTQPPTKAPTKRPTRYPTNGPTSVCRGRKGQKGNMKRCMMMMMKKGKA